MSKKFRTVYDRNIVYSNEGNPYINDYKISHDDDGKRILVKNGVINVYNEIQASRAQCDINIILDRYINTGDETVLNRAPSFYGDVSEIPTNYADILKLSAEANNAFYSLTPEQREKFDNSPDVFFASIGSDKFNSVMFPKDTVESEVKIDEQKSE